MIDTATTADGRHAAKVARGVAWTAAEEAEVAALRAADTAAWEAELATKRTAGTWFEYAAVLTA